VWCPKAEPLEIAAAGLLHYKLHALPVTKPMSTIMGPLHIYAMSDVLQLPSVLWLCWLGDGKGIRPVKRWVLVCWWWWFDWSFARFIAPAVTTTSIIFSSNKIQNGDILVLANPGPPGKWREWCTWNSIHKLTVSFLTIDKKITKRGVAWLMQPLSKFWNPSIFL